MYILYYICSIHEDHTTMLITRYTSVLIKTTGNTMVSPTYVPPHRWVICLWYFAFVRKLFQVFLVYPLSVIIHSTIKTHFHYHYLSSIISVYALEWNVYFIFEEIKYICIFIMYNCNIILTSDNELDTKITGIKFVLRIERIIFNVYYVFMLIIWITKCYFLIGQFLYIILNLL